MLRLLTTGCYFLPFTFFLVTCNGLELNFAYNKKEAGKNILSEKESAYCAAVVDSAQSVTTKLPDTSIAIVPVESISSDVFNKDTANATISKNFLEKLAIKIIRPTNSSLSGLGSIFYYKNLTGRVVSALSLLTSLMLLMAFKVFKSQRVKLYLLIINVLCVTIFIVDSFISEVTLLWGVWTLLFLLLIQFLVELKNTPKA